jgi:hypothetical protein
MASREGAAAPVNVGLIAGVNQSNFCGNNGTSGDNKSKDRYGWSAAYFESIWSLPCEGNQAHQSGIGCIRHPDDISYTNSCGHNNNSRLQSTVNQKHTRRAQELSKSTARKCESMREIQKKS